MKPEKREQWIDEVFQSMEGSRRAQPKPDLLARIEQRIDGEETRILPISLRRIAAVAAILLLMLNGFAISQFSQSSATMAEEPAGSVYDLPLISDYNLYDHE